MTKASFELQFMLNTRLTTLDKFPIRLGDLLVMDIDGTALPETVVWSNQPDVRLQELVCVGMGADRFYHRPIFYNGWIPRDETWRCVLSVDPAGRGRDELAWAVVAELNGNLFLLESGGSTLDTPMRFSNTWLVSPKNGTSTTSWRNRIWVTACFRHC